MKRPCFLVLSFVSLTLGLVAESQGSLFGPWRRYRSETLGFQMPYVDDWQVTTLKNVIVFAMQGNPDPYVRLAVGRIPKSEDSFEASVTRQLERAHQDGLQKRRCQVSGFPAIRVEGDASDGRILDFYVDHGDYRYWISFLSDRADGWDAYRKSFELIVSDFRFLPETTTAFNR
jgi:hypothetical protein